MTIANEIIDGTIPTSSTAVRQALIAALRLDLVGPSSEEEILSDPPGHHYLCGILYPQGAQPEPEEDNERAEAGMDDETSEDEGVPPSEDPMLPASLGLTFAVSGLAQTLDVEYGFGTYTEQEPPEGEKTTRWRRIPWTGIFELPLQVGWGTSDLPAGATLEWRIRTEDDIFLVTIFLVNRNHQDDGKNDRLCLFQPILSVTAGTEEVPLIVAREDEFGFAEQDKENHTYKLLYSDRFIFGVGHGCTMDWAPSSQGRTHKVMARIIPDFTVPLVAAKELGLDKVPGLSMRRLAEAADGLDVLEAVRPLLDNYESWIRGQEKLLVDVPPQLSSAASDHIAACREALARMDAGLSLVAEDVSVFYAFQFANKAMRNQRLHALWAKSLRRGGKRVEFDTFASTASEPTWRPFQLAFILMCLSDVVNPSRPSRDLVDLLWFPTGGGKTEAYLGLAAFTMGLRRLRRGSQKLSGDGGVTVLMRYTLRLLTIQQFQRASTLICACELLRREDPERWGNTPFSIGLWVGMKATPNSIKDTVEALEMITQRGDQYRGPTPIQLLSCPWCGETLKHANYSVDEERRRVRIRCSNEACEYSKDDGLPVLVVDEEIYLRCPDMLIGTADKFAALPWNAKTSALFGRVSRYCERHGYLTTTDDDCGFSHNSTETLPKAAVTDFEGFLPPELIIQDELHLISGPLGTLAGLYEIAIDRLAERPECGVPGPKIIASTATIRRAQEQVGGLFGRELRQFPPPGLKAGDSFFAFEDTSVPGRTYLGIRAPGRSGKTVMIRVTAVLADKAEELASELAQVGENPAIVDPYGTIVSYFNSLRVLGGSLRLAEDDVAARMKLLGAKRGAEPKTLRYEELTSRLKSFEIPLVLERLESPAASEDGLDMLFATNMISVGVDVDRLGLMVVNGQPKGTSEYIQATSRVGRNIAGPGLVVTLYSWARPRDLDHYERFISYHSMLYRYVEATSVTPLSPRALDKGLHAVVYALVRHLQPGMMGNASPGSFERTPETDDIARWLLHRASNTAHLHENEIQEMETAIFALLDEWSNRAAVSEGRLRYRASRFDKTSDPEKNQVLMKEAGRDFRGARLTLTSLRDVEKSSTLYFIKEDRK